VDFDQIRKLSPDVYVCVIDGVAALHGRLVRDHAIEHSLKDLIVWREEEIIGTEMLCKGIDEKAALYILARGDGVDTAETFYRLIFEKDIGKAYLSFPMTHVVGMADVVGQIKRFRAAMNEMFACFDPGDVEESDLPYLAQQAKEKGAEFVEVDFSGEKLQLGVDQVMQIERDINSQIYARDFLLIDQADMIISYIPALADGSPVISSGVERELQHAHEAAKEVYVIWTASKRPSVFVTQTATKVFVAVAEAEAFFRKKGYLKK